MPYFVALRVNLGEISDALFDVVVGDGEVFSLNPFLHQTRDDVLGLAGFLRFTVVIVAAGQLEAERTGAFINVGVSAQLSHPT